MNFPIPVVVLGGAMLLLSACATPGAVTHAQSYEGRSEKAVLAVLRTVKADEAQRAAILAAYDRHNPTLERLTKDWTQIEQDWTALDRLAADFNEQAAALAQRRQQVAAQQLTEGAAFEREVAAALTPEQWTDWRELWDLVATPRANDCGPGGPGGRRR